MITAIQTDIIAIAALSAAVCAIPGTFLVLRQSATVADTANKSSVLGFSLGLAILMQISSPLLVICGTATAYLGLCGIKVFSNGIKLPQEHSSTVISGFLLALGVIIITYFSKITYLDIETILLGELALLPFDRFIVFGYDVGSQAIYSLLLVLALNLLFILIFYKDLKSSCIDKDYALSIRLRTNVVDMMFPLFVSLVLAVSFQTAGAFMTTAFLLGPAATAHFYTKRLSAMIITALVLSLVSCLTGYALAHNFDTSIASAIVCVMGVLFIATVLAAPETGLIVKLMQYRHINYALHKDILLIHLLNYGAIPVDMAQVADYLNWKKRYLLNMLESLALDGCVIFENGTVLLTDNGRMTAEKIYCAAN